MLSPERRIRERCMDLQTVAVMSAGDMGPGVARAIRESGRRASPETARPWITSLAGRSDRTRGLAEKAGLEDVGTLEALIREADIVLSIMPPAAALAFATSAAGVMTSTGSRPTYADLNAISP